MATNSIASNSIAADAASLDPLRRQAEKDPSGAVRQAANEFEALFARQLLKSMRDAMPKSGLFDGPGKRMFEDMLDDQLSRSMSGQTGGLGDMLTRHLSRYMSDPNAAAAQQGQGTKPDHLPRIVGQAAGVPAGAGTQTPAAKMMASDGKVSMNGLPNALQLALQPGNGAAPTPGKTANQVPNQMPQALSVAVSRTSSQPEPVQGVGAGPLEASRTSFVDRLWPHAQQAESVTGVPAAFVVGQAALESGWGRGEIRHPDGRSAHNLFGIKATGDWQGQTVDVRTTEYENGRRVSRVETFRSYASYGDAFQDWVGLMTRLPRYAGVLNGASSPEQFANGLQQAGYATDPNYGNKLQKVIQQTIAIQQARKG